MLAESSLATACVPFESSTHGRARRAQRDISKRDLQAAVKHGVKEPGWPDRKTGEPRWKYTHNDVVYITDKDSIREVTAYAIELPLDEVEIPSRLEDGCLEAKRRLSKDPGIITSHTVIVVDMSGSMKQSDMNGHKSRSRAVYYALAEEFTAPHLHPVTASTGPGGSTIAFTDVVTLVEMRSVATVVFEREPFSWILYNKFVALAGQHGARDHGYYYPSLRTAFSCLKGTCHPKCALGLWFLSDGRPSDNGFHGSIDFLIRHINQLIMQECSQYGDRLTFQTVGFGSISGPSEKSGEEFAVLKRMSETAGKCGAHATFLYSALSADALSTALSSTLSSVSKTRTLLSRLSSADNEDRRLLTPAKKGTFHNCDVDRWNVFTSSNSDCGAVRREINWVTIESGGYQTVWTDVKHLSPQATGIRVSETYFGQGAERIVFKMNEVNAAGAPVGEPLVAKSSRHIKHDQQGDRWHKTFAKTQMRAKKVAKIFNQKLDNLRVSKESVPRVDFLACAVYSCWSGTTTKTYLAEKQLNVDIYQKWNNNEGAVDGIPRVNNRVVGPQLAGQRPSAAQMMGIAEAESEEEDGDLDHLLPSDEVKELERRVLPCDIPQAFSHFTYRYSKREYLICDLQGTLDMAVAQPAFELTDPAIHSVRRSYGTTDLGGRGMRAFFRTHQCNAVCVLLRLAPAKDRARILRE